MIAKEKYRATLVRVDPVADNADVTLKPFDSDVPDRQKMMGSVLDEEGKPIAGAIVWIAGAKKGARTWWGRVKQVERVSVTDEDGKFLLTSEVPYDQWALTVRASGYCQNKIEHQPTGSKPYEIRLKPGVLLSGRVVNKLGKPVAKHVVGILQRDRSALRNWVGEKTIATDEKGRFSFTAVNPDDEWIIYSAIDKRADVEFFQSEFFDSDSNGKVQDLGKFEIKGHGKLSGRLVLPRGESLPKELRVSVGRKYAWNAQTATVLADGSFQFPNLPLSEPLIISVYAKGFQLDLAKQNLQLKEDSMLGIFLDKESTEIEIPLIKKVKPGPT